MAEKKMEEKVDYTVPDFDIDNTETPLQEVSKEEAIVKSPTSSGAKILAIMTVLINETTRVEPLKAPIQLIPFNVSFL